MTELNLTETISELQNTSFKAETISRTFRSTASYNTLLQPSTPSGKFVKLDKAGRFFRSQNFSFIRQLNVYLENPSVNSQGVHLAIANFKGEFGDPLRPSRTHDNRIVFFPEKFTNAFFLKFSEKGNRPRITKIEVFGIDLDKIEKQKSNIVKFFDSSLSIDKTIEKANLEIAELNDKHKKILENIKKAESINAELHSDFEANSSILRSLLEEQENAQLQLDLIKSKLSETSETELQKRNNCEQLDQQATNLNTEIAHSKAQLSVIINDKELISDEYKDYVKEGKSQGRIYTVLLTLSISCALASLYLLYSGAKGLLTTSFNSAEDVFASFILRLPFATVISGALFASLALAKFMFNKIISINEERLVLSKLLIIAKETVYSTAGAMGINDTEKFKSRIELKLELLKAYLANSIGDSKIILPRPSSDGDKNEDTLEHLEKPTQAEPLAKASKIEPSI
ncbi:hypothetical protein [uncultured Pseudomonas sp.]|uniref:hypothetical protein n=1 Tax=uncultured Pseudomonas sp. TaxID=114707 RepID=UPI0025FBA965|nr:hypothetical protein [uncultured Pseudomonas sp.]